MSGVVVNAGVIEAILRLRDELTPALGRINAGLGKTGGDLLAMGQTIAPLSLALTGVGLAGMKMATDLNRSMANVASLIPGNTERINELKASVQSMAIETGKSTDDLSDGLYNVISAFGDTADTVAILDTNARAAAAGLATTTDAINLTSAVTKGYGDTSAAAVAQASDLALLTVRLGQTTFPELAASIGRVTPLSAALKVSQEELFGVMATFTGVTGGAAEVSTQLRGVLQSLMAPTDEMQALFAKLGVSSGTAAIEQLGLQGVIQKVVAEAEAAGAPLQEYLSSIEGQTLALAASGGQAATFTEKIAAMREAAGTTAVAFQEQTEGVNAAGHAWETFKQEMVVALQLLGDELLPVLVDAGEAMRPVVDFALDIAREFKELPEPVRNAAVALGMIVAISAPTLTAIGFALNGIAGGITAIGGASQLATPGVSQFFGILSGPFGLALATIGTGFLIAKRDLDAYQSAQDRLNAVAEDASLNLTAYGRSLQTITPEAMAAANALADLGLQTSKSVGPQAAILTEAQKEALKRLREEINNLKASLTGAAADAEIKKWDIALKELGGASNLSFESLMQVISAASRLQREGGTLTPALRGVITTLSDAKPAGEMFVAWNARVQASLLGLVQTLPIAGQSAEDFFASLTPRNDVLGLPTQFLPGVRTEIDLLTGKVITGTETQKKKISELSQAWLNLGSTIVGAIQGGGDVGQAIGASLGGGLGKDLGESLATAVGGTFGKAVGGFLGPLGALAGGALGKFVGGLFGDSNGKQELLAANEEISKMRDRLIETYGSFAAIGDLDRALGTDVAAGWLHQGPRGAEAFEKSARELEKRLQAVHDEMSRISATGGLASAELIRFRDAMAGDADVQAFALAQVQTAGSAVGSMLDALSRASTASAKARIESQMEAVRTALEDADDDLRDELERQLEALEEQAREVTGVVQLTAGGASSMASIVLAAWDGTAAGLRDLQPTIDQLQQAMQASGLAGGEAFGQLASMAGLATGEVSGPLLEAINHGTAALTAMYNSGFLTQETFAGMVDEIMAQRDALLATGATAGTVNGAMQADLQRIWELVQDGKYAIDEKTAALLAEAEAAGQVGDRFRSTEDRMVAALERIASMFETVFSDRLAEAAAEGAAAAARALNGIPTDIDFNVRGHVDRYGNLSGDSGLPGYANGTNGYEYFGAGTKVMLHGWEKVTPLGAEGSGSPSLTIHIHNPSVRDDRDIDELTEAIVHRIPTYLQWTGGR